MKVIANIEYMPHGFSSLSTTLPAHRIDITGIDQEDALMKKINEEIKDIGSPAGNLTITAWSDDNMGVSALC